MSIIIPLKPTINGRNFNFTCMARIFPSSPVAHTLLIVRLVLRAGICVPADDDTVNECENSSRRRRAETKELLLAVGDALKMIISLGASLLEWYASYKYTIEKSSGRSQKIQNDAAQIFSPCSALLLQSPGWTAAKHSFIRESRAREWKFVPSSQRQSSGRREKNGTRERYNRRRSASLRAARINSAPECLQLLWLITKHPLSHSGVNQFRPPVFLLTFNRLVRCKNGKRQRPKWIWHASRNYL